MIFNFNEKLDSIYFHFHKLGAYCLPQKNYHYYDNLELEEILAIAIIFSRRNFRLLYVLVEFFANNFKKIRPFYLKQYLIKQKEDDSIFESNPFCILGVIWEFAKKINTESELNDFFKIILRDFQNNKPYELFNIGDVFSIKYARKNAFYSLAEFKKWHFYCNEAPILKHLKVKDKKYNFDKKVRFNILSFLFKKYKKIRLSDYLKALDFTITRQKAHADLREYPKVKCFGDKKGRMYHL